MPPANGGSRKGGDESRALQGETASGVLTIELGGTTAGSLFDLLAVAGKVTLDGTLNVTVLGAFVPALGAFFRPLTFGSRVGVFATITGLDFGGGRLLDPLYTAGNLTLTVI